MGLLGNDKKKIGQYLEDLTNKIQYLRIAKGGEPILRLFDLMSTAVDYEPSTRYKLLIRDVGDRLGAGYRGYPESTEAILEAALNYAELSLRQNKTMTMQEWHDTIFAIAVSQETNKSSKEEVKVKETKTPEKTMNTDRIAPVDKEMELIEQMPPMRLYDLEPQHVKRLTHNFKERYCRQIVCKVDNIRDQWEYIDWLGEMYQKATGEKKLLEFLEEWDYQVATGRLVCPLDITEGPEEDDFREEEETILQSPEVAYNAQTQTPCFTSTQMGILLYAIGCITEEEGMPGKTTIGEVVQKISGYSAKTVSQNMKGAFRPADIDAVANAIESRFPKLAAKVRSL